MPNFPSKKTDTSPHHWIPEGYLNLEPIPYTFTDANGNIHERLDCIYKSKWRKRKERRMQNRYALENGEDTPATRMMKKRGITGRRYGWVSDEENNMKLSIKEIDN